MDPFDQDDESAAPSERWVDRLTSQAELLVEAGRSLDAARLLERALSLSPDNAYLHYLRGLALFDLDPDESTRSLDGCLARDPSFAPAHALRGGRWMAEGRYQAAEESFLAALRLDPLEVSTYVSYVQLLNLTGHRKRAEALCREAIKIDPHSSAAHLALSATLRERGRTAKALVAARNGLELNPVGRDEHEFLALLYLVGGRPFRARRHAREALRAEPGDDTESMFLLADRCCRLLYLPTYYFHLLIMRVPGQHYALCAGVLILLAASSGLARGFLTLFLVLGVLYAIAVELATDLWVKVVPPK